MARTLETILIGRDLLSPVLTQAAGSVRAYDQSVTQSTGRVTTVVEGGARRQSTAMQQLGASATQAATTLRNASQAMIAARERETAAAAAVTAAEERLAALRASGTASGLRLALAEDNLAQATLRANAAQQQRVTAGAQLNIADRALTTANEQLVVAQQQQTAASGRQAAGNQRVAATSGEATTAMRAQQAATGSLASANGLLVGGLSPLTAGLSAVALGLGYAVYRGSQFDSAMSQVQAATMESGAAMEDLRDLAIRLGADTQYSSEEAAQGITELAKAGVDTADIMGGGLAGALDLAAAGGLDVADAAEIAATQMVVFNLKGDQMAHVADLLAAGAGKAQGSVQDMALALQYAGLPAEGLGLSIEETTGTLALFASSGLVGEKAGTSFRGMLVSLTNPVGKTRTLMEELGLTFFDAQGRFVGMEGVAGQLQSRLGDLTQEQRNAALAQIFGNEALGAAQALYNGGAAGVAEWTRKVNDAGYAAEQAAALNDNLRGDLEKLGGAFDAAMTQIGDGAQGPLRFLVQALTDIIDVGGDVIAFINGLPTGFVAAGVAIGAYLLWGRQLLDQLALLRVWANQNLLSPLIVGFTNLLTGTTSLTGGLAAARTAAAGLITTLAPLAAAAAIGYAVMQMIEFANAGDDARDAIAEMNKTIEESDSNAGRFGNVTSSLDQIRDKITELRPFVESWSAENRSWFERAFVPVTGEVEDARQSLQVYEDALADIEGQQERMDQSTAVLGRRYNMTRAEVEDFADAHGIDLSGSLQIVQGDFIRVADAAGVAATGISTAADGALTGYENFATYAQALGLSDEATEELNKRTMELAESMADFIDPLGAYTSLLDQKKEAERTAAEAAAVAAGDSATAWEDYVGDVSVSFDEYMQMLEDQVTAQQNWETNMLMLAGRVSQGTLDQLARMGPEGAPLVADLVNQSDAELTRFSDLTDMRSEEAVGRWRDNLVQGGAVLSQVAAVAGQDTANALAEQLAAGTVTVAEIARQYGVSIANGVNPVLQSLGQQAVSVVRTSLGFGFTNSDGNVVDYFANGGMSEQHVAQIAPAGSWRVWAEPETGGESYIPLAPAKRERSMSIWRETGKRLNAPEAAFFANGGFASAADVPRPRSTAPFGAPLSTVAQAAMQAEYDAAVRFLNANAESVASVSGGPAGGSAIGGGWQAIWNVVKAAIPQARINSTYRPGDPGYHGRGKAIDFGFGSGPGGAGSPGLASIARFLYSGYGRTLAELIYDGIGDNTPDVKNGRDHTYNAATRNQHRNHVHAAVYANGGLVEPGGLLNPHIRDSGGPLLPGFTYNGLGRPEMVLPMANGGMVRAEDGSLVPASFYNQTAGATTATLLASAQRRLAAGQPLTAEQTAVVSPLLTPAASQPGYGAADTPVVIVNNWIDGQQFRSLATQVTNTVLGRIAVNRSYA